MSSPYLVMTVIVGVIAIGLLSRYWIGEFGPSLFGAGWALILGALVGALWPITLVAGAIYGLQLLVLRLMKRGAA